MVKPNESATSEEKLNTEEILSIVQKSEKSLIGIHKSLERFQDYLKNNLLKK